MGPTTLLERDLAKLVRSSPALTITIASTAFVIFKVVLATRGRVPDSLAVLSAANLTAVLAGLALLVTPAAVVLAAAYLWLRMSLELPRPFPVMAQTLAFVLTVVAFAISPWFLFVPLAFFVVIEVVANYLRRNERIRPSETRPSRPWLLEGAVVAGLVLGFFLDPSILWTPTEIITMNGAAPIGAYYIGEAAGWTTLLRSSDGVVMLVRLGDITGRQLCGGSAGRYSLLQILIPPAPTAPCP